MAFKAVKDEVPIVDGLLVELAKTAASSGFSSTTTTPMLSQVDAVVSGMVHTPGLLQGDNWSDDDDEVALPASPKVCLLSFIFHQHLPTLADTHRCKPTHMPTHIL